MEGGRVVKGIATFVLLCFLCFALFCFVLYFVVAVALGSGCGTFCVEGFSCV